MVSAKHTVRELCHIREQQSTTKGLRDKIIVVEYYSIVNVTLKEGLAELVPGKSSFGVTTTKIVGSLFS